MECPNCTFQNTPGLPVCVRCQSRLDLGDISIEPPRASSSALIRASARASLHARLTFASAFQTFISSARNIIPHQLSVRDLLWSIIPGMGQIRSGRRLIGRAIALAWLTLIALAALNIGDAVGYFFALTAIGVHCFAVSLVLAPVMIGTSLISRLGVGLLTWGTLVGILYYPAVLLSRQFAVLTQIEIVRRSAIVQRGDVLVSTGPWSRPDSYQRGDTILYRISAFSLPGAYVNAGIGVERIVGLPGDHVKLTAGRVFVNGVELPQATAFLAEVSALPDFELTATTQEYVVIPSLANWYEHGRVGNVAPLLVAVSRVPIKNIDGRIFYRIRPWTRTGYFSSW